MPELPEVETVRTGLENSIKAKIVKRAIIRCKKLRYPFPDGLEKLLEGKAIKAIKRRSKYLLLELNDGNTLIMHLGMSGKVLYKQQLPDEFAKHDHFVMEFTDGSAIVFNDARRFGLIDVCKTSTLPQNKHFKALGPEPLEGEFTADYLKGYLKSRQKSIKVTLMDASCVVGVGNIYAAESLFKSNIDPAKPAAKVSAKKLPVLVQNIQEVLKDAIKSGGSTLRDYVRSDGDVGYFQHNFKVYGRENQPCYICGTSIKRIVQQGRSTFYCPDCQK
jgi:formamidopyrimidine-DNA glycosylase